MRAASRTRTAPVRVFNDAGELLAQGEVSVGLLRATPDRAALLKELARPKRPVLPKADTPLVAGLRASQRRRKADTLADLAQRLDAVEQRLGLGRHQRRQPGYLPAEVLPPATT